STAPDLAQKWLASGISGAGCAHCVRSAEAETPPLELHAVARSPAILVGFGTTEEVEKPRTTRVGLLHGVRGDDCSCAPLSILRIEAALIIASGIAIMKAIPASDQLAMPAHAVEREHALCEERASDAL